ncbi:MAG: UDP-glucose/GDP-mannose dehydrogenase family protein [Sporomusaceae bacterium]|nr:UDP-glucose/GDP-mannose dehydrogenase family protein [Sporomusaceae bacterium]
MNITIIGTGYVGLVTGACLADVGNNVVCVDKDENKIQALKNGIIPIYEPGLENLIKSNCAEGRLVFVTSLLQVEHDTDFYFIAVGTPQRQNGEANLDYIFEAVAEVGEHIKDYCVVITKSTVPVGTTDKIERLIRRELEKRNCNIDIDVVNNPEFLKQGAAVSDFMKPDRVIVGCKGDRARHMMSQLYAPFVRSHDRLLFMDVRASEMTKYAANCMLATKISFMNEVAMICDQFGVDVEEVRKGIGSDSRIGYSFIYPGCGYGGSCFPKDIKALIQMAKEHNFDPQILTAVDGRNERQKQVLVEKVSNRFGADLSGRKFAVWGLSFKPDTDDMREAPSIPLLRGLINMGANIVAYDQKAVKTAESVLPQEWFAQKRLTFAKGQYDAVDGVDAVILVTEWKPFRTPDFKQMRKRMRLPVIFDGRNQYDPQVAEQYGFEYYGIGRQGGKVSAENSAG